MLQGIGCNSHLTCNGLVSLVDGSVGMWSATLRLAHVCWTKYYSNICLSMGLAAGEPQATGVGASSTTAAPQLGTRLLIGECGFLRYHLVRLEEGNCNTVAVLDAKSMGRSVVTSPVRHSVPNTLPYFIANKDSTVNDMVIPIVANNVTIAKDLSTAG
ncbi:MAG: hypothetical protein M1826_000122 [Phylliscum demangeonii]|nr:MAG: hypothetical protein M1826_000122 [Phylliscum demangeonii]